MSDDDDRSESGEEDAGDDEVLEDITQRIRGLLPEHSDDKAVSNMIVTMLREFGQEHPQLLAKAFEAMRLNGRKKLGPATAHRVRQCAKLLAAKAFNLAQMAKNGRNITVQKMKEISVREKRARKDMAKQPENPADAAVAPKVSNAPPVAVNVAGASSVPPPPPPPPLGQQPLPNLPQSVIDYVVTSVIVLDNVNGVVHSQPLLNDIAQVLSTFKRVAELYGGGPAGGGAGAGGRTRRFGLSALYDLSRLTQQLGGRRSARVYEDGFGSDVDSDSTDGDEDSFSNNVAFVSDTDSSSEDDSDLGSDSDSDLDSDSDSGSDSGSGSGSDTGSDFDSDSDSGIQLGGVGRQRLKTKQRNVRFLQDYYNLVMSEDASAKVRERGGSGGARRASTLPRARAARA